MLIEHVRTAIRKFKDGSGLVPEEVWADLTLHAGITREAMATQLHDRDKRIPIEKGTGDPVVDGVPVRLRIVKRGTIEARHTRVAGKLVVVVIGDKPATVGGSPLIVVPS